MQYRLGERIVDAIEWTASAFVFAMMANTVIAVILRRFFATAIPDHYDLGRFMLCTLVLWGIATTSYRGGHITMDLAWTFAGEKLRQGINVFAELVVLMALVVLCFSLLDQTLQARNDNILTYDIRLPTWPFLAIAWCGTVSAIILIAIRVFRGVAGRGSQRDNGSGAS